MAPGLLGPPELQSSIDETTVDQTLNKSQPSITTPQNPTCYQSTGNTCLDFFHVAPETSPEELIQRLQLAYQTDPLKTLKLVCNLRGVRGTGKNDKEGFYASALWLHQNHPKTLANNVGLVALFGSLKDLLEILFRVIEGLDAREKMKDAWEGEKSKFFDNRWTQKAKLSELDEKKRKAAKAKKAVDRYTHDPEYSFLYDRVCEVFAKLLREDVKLLQEGGREGEISLAAKWCPSLDSSYDESLLICEAIAKKVFPREEYVEYKDIEEAHYAYLVRTRLRKEVLVPLRKALELPEVYMCAKRWRDIPYDKVHSLAMHSNKKVFLKRDVNGFEGFLEGVRDGESTIAAGAVLPQQLVSEISHGNVKSDEVSELQWNRLVDDLRKQGPLIDCTAVSDSLSSDACVSLMLLVSELTREPWKGKVVLSNPYDAQQNGVFEIEGENLSSKVAYIQESYSDDSLNLQYVFDSILIYAVENSLTDNQMIRRLFVFTELENGQVSALSTGTWQTEYAEIQRKFLDNGYQKAPQVVFWNLNNSATLPAVKCDQPGVAVVNGFSKNLLTLFFQELEDFTPEAVMDAAISKPEYEMLVVHD